MTIASGTMSDTGVSKLRDKLVRMNKRAVRLRVAEMVLTIVSRKPIKRRGPSGLDYTDWVNEVEVNGELPCINGWRVAARIEFTDKGNLVHVAPYIDSIDSKYRTIGNICDHCNTNRRRNDIIVIRHFDGRELCVGRNCLADYIRSGNAEGMIFYAGLVGSNMCAEFEGDKDYRGANLDESVMTIVSSASICIRRLGWVSGSDAYKYGKGSTKDDVCALLYPPHDSAAHRDWENWINERKLTVCDFDNDLADKAIEWAKSVDSSKSEYLYNLSVLANMEYVGADKFGYVVSIIPAYNRAMEKETKRAEKAKNKGEKVYIGNIKERVKDLDVTIVRVNYFEGNYGVVTIVSMEANLPNNEYAPITWFASGSKEFEVGENYRMTATIKAHEDKSNYGKQTVVTRAKTIKVG